MPSLSRAEAVARRAAISVESYLVDLDLTGDGPHFRSRTEIHFTAVPGAETFVELKPARLLAVRLDDRDLDIAGLDENRLPLTGLDGRHTLHVEAEMAYSRTGEGIHRFVDPADGETYLYAMSFLDEAQRIFAAFDQPDLKAPVTLSVTAPPEWTVAANAPVAAEPAPGRWEFAPTPPLATYLVTLIAGPYHVRRDSHDGIPLALYCRRSLAAHLDADAEEIFTVTRQCFDRFHELFAERYPFGKYDQAFVPEFNAGAMENPGLVTFRDDLVFRSAVTESQRELRATTIAHEMAHMWFGDLVTMRWWDDLWLNESFAEYLGTRVTAEATRFDQAWTTFALRRKAWGYAADQRPSTHPVAPAEVTDAAQALTNFDGISYAKGAAVLRQLVAWLGDEAFLAGLQRPLRRAPFRQRHPRGPAEQPGGGGRPGPRRLGAALAAAGRGEHPARRVGAWTRRVATRRSRSSRARPPPIRCCARTACCSAGTASRGAPAAWSSIWTRSATAGVRSSPNSPVEPASVLLANDGDLTFAEAAVGSAFGPGGAGAAAVDAGSTCPGAALGRDARRRHRRRAARRATWCS